MTIKYLSYIFHHKYHVFTAGLKLRVPVWQLIVHDLSKFRPDEFWPYAEYFYGSLIPVSEAWKGRERQEAFNVAWLKHIHRNPHHHQFWVLREDSGDVKALPMPEHYIREMVADWIGAGKAMGKNNTVAWYDANKDKMVLHPETRKRVEELIARVACNRIG